MQQGREEAVGVFELAPLRRKDVAEAAVGHGLDPDRFIGEVLNANAVPFTIKPLTLNLLLRLYQRDGSLPTRRLDLYSSGCLSLCEEHSPNRRGAGRLGRLNEKQRYRLASRIAAVTMLANRYAVWTDPVTEHRPEEDMALSELAVGGETGDFQPFDATNDHLREVLDTGLFSSRGPARIGWAHQSYAEFLAADYLVSKHTSRDNIVKALCHPSGGLIPQLWMVAAWAASLSPELRNLLIAQEPFTLLRGDLNSWSPDDLSVLTEALLTAFQEQRAHDFAWGIASEYRKLAHPAIADQLRPFVVERGKQVVARRAAFMIARACSVRELLPELLTVALDPTEDSSIRAQAVSAIETCGDAAAHRNLLPLARGELGPDPNLEIKGRALRLLWPGQLTSDEVFAQIEVPEDGFVGAYVMFVTRDLPTSLTGSDLIPALRWTTDYAQSASLTNQFHTKQFADSVMVRAWDHADTPDVMQALVRYVSTVLRHSHQLFMSTMNREDEAFRERIRDDVDKRHQFLLIVLSHNQSLQPHDGWMLRRAGFLHKTDLGWLLSIGPSGDAPVNGLNEESLCMLTSAVFDPWDAAELEANYDLVMSWPLLHQRFSWFFDGVQLDSQEAAQMRQHHEFENEHGREAPVLDPPPAERVRMDLDRFEAGETDAWWHLNRNLSLRATSRHYDDLQLRISEMPGWSEATEETRTRILQAAKKFLEGAVSSIDTWLGTTSYKFNDYSAYRALLLLYELDRATYSALDDAVWQKWAPVVVATQKETGTETARLHEAITADAIRKAPAEVASTIQRLIRIERRRSRRAPQNQNALIGSFFILRTLPDALESTELKEVIYCELQNRNNSPGQFESLLHPLLQASFEPARRLALRMLRAPGSATPARRPYTLAAATGLLLTSPKEAWSAIWRWVEADPDFGSELFQTMGHNFGRTAPFYSALDDARAGQLYLWLEQTFPAQSDARNQRQGQASWVGPLESVALLRDGVLRDLVGRGTEAGVAILRQIVTQLHDRPWLVYQLLEAEQMMRTRTWIPLLPSEVLAITEIDSAMLIQSAAHLQEVLLRILRNYEQELHGEQTPVRALWDLQADRTLRPVDEDALSDHVRLFLKRELIDSGTVANREVEIGRVAGARLGSRTDIKVEAITRATSGRSHNVIMAVIETKGCWNPQLRTAMRTQLVEDYLARLAAPVGIYLVGWFDKRRWDPTDSRRARTPDWSCDEAQTEFDAQAVAQPPAFAVQAVVLDCHAP